MSAGQTATGRVFCLYEDRPGGEVGVRLAIASLLRHAPGARVVFFAPTLPAGLAAWLGRRAAVEWRPTAATLPRGWDVKPHCLLQLLDGGAAEAVWLDSDLIVTGDLETWIRRAPAEALIVAEEPRHLAAGGTAARTGAWSLPRGRERGFAINTAVLRVAPRHRPLLVRWAGLLGDSEYQRRQREPLLERPLHLRSDQDVLGALLGSAEFGEVVVAVLRAGREIVHSGGLRMDGAVERLARIGRGAPLVVHAIAAKPWEVLAADAGDPNFNWWLLRLAQEVSGYVAEARSYRDEIEMAAPWLDRMTAAGWLLRVAGLGHGALRGLPLAVAAGAAHGLGWVRRRA